MLWLQMNVFMEWVCSYSVALKWYLPAVQRKRRKRVSIRGGVMFSTQTRMPTKWLSIISVLHVMPLNSNSMSSLMVPLLSSTTNWYVKRTSLRCRLSIRHTKTTASPLRLPTKSTPPKSTTPSTSRYLVSTPWARERLRASVLQQRLFLKDSSVSSLSMPSPLRVYGR